ncbi:LOW QUALITY PROTEIN: hypothetical protein TorRG33x02_283000 [Trema orientale]|uniref:Uncharacterized protein n=1 Tax=Trema orientale TaxID=63057 RepID=A0A2P5CIW8_TREOI|nr:LOW QUALITY PROTEIN: hypothetical protein TorRG33x02_283000 [Trema orientale]
MIEQHQKPVKFRKNRITICFEQDPNRRNTKIRNENPQFNDEKPPRRERARFTHPGNKFSSGSNTIYTNFPEKNRFGEECENRSTMRKLEEFRIEKNQSLSFILFYFILNEMTKPKQNPTTKSIYKPQIKNSGLNPLYLWCIYMCIYLQIF